MNNNQNNINMQNINQTNNNNQQQGKSMIQKKVQTEFNEKKENNITQYRMKQYFV